MNKQRFIKILKVPDNLKDSLPDLQDLQKDYPYAQAVHVLLALAHKQNNTNDATNALNYAAMYVADRHNLKELVTVKKTFKETPKEKDTSETIVVQEETGAIKQPGILPEPNRSADTASDAAAAEGTAEKEVPRNEHRDEPKEQEERPTAAKKVVAEIGNKFRESLLHKLEKLQIAKEKWSSSLSEEEDDDKGTLVKKIAKSVKSKGEKKKTNKAEKIKKDKPAAKKNRAEEPNTAPKEVSGKAPEEAPKQAPEESSLRIDKDEDDEPGKIEKQQELISRFIEISPSIKAKPNNPPIISADQEDLSVPSTSFKENLISENLADILVSQGKDDKAIDIYKKLIWKFPQKKAYFAARIEELTKKKG